MPIRKRDKKRSHKRQTRNHETLNFRTFKEIKGYSVDANDGKVGEAKEFYIDTDNWMTSYIIVMGSGKTIMLPSQWVEKIQPLYERLLLNLNKDFVLTSHYAFG
jgi:hypothetical protein